jgi:hypothetical protein
VLDGRAANLLQRLHSESQVAELRGAEAAAEEAAAEAEAAVATEPATPASQAAALQRMGVGDVPRLPPIRTRVARSRLVAEPGAYAQQPLSA